jgi:hypothetical protein
MRKGPIVAENETIALEQDDAFWRKAAWLLIRRLGGEVVISDEEWEHVPEAPELILARTDGAMRWVATRRSAIPVLEPASPLAADPDPTYTSTDTLIRTDPSGRPAAPQLPGQLPLLGTEPGDA